jgi:ammonia channel protein AmtB
MRLKVLAGLVAGLVVSTSACAAIANNGSFESGVDGLSFMAYRRKQNGSVLSVV